MESTDRAISSADRLLVPLKSMCSIKCVIPFCSGDSRREPVPTHTPTETERTCGMTSVMTRTPFDKCVNSMSRTVVVEFARVAKKKVSSLFCTTFEACLASFVCGAADCRYRLWLPCAVLPTQSMKTRRLHSSPFMAVLVMGSLAGCSSSMKSPDVADNLRGALNQAGFKKVSVSQDREKGVVTLGGEVPAAGDKAQVQTIAQSIVGAEVVANQVAVIPPGAESAAKKVNADLDEGIGKNPGCRAHYESTSQGRELLGQEWSGHPHRPSALSGQPPGGRKNCLFRAECATGGERAADEGSEGYVYELRLIVRRQCYDVGHAGCWSLLLANAFLVLPLPASDLRIIREQCARGDRSALESALKQGAQVNAAQPDGATALGWAASRNDEESVKILLRAGANPNTADENGDTPLSLACGVGGYRNCPRVTRLEG